MAKIAFLLHDEELVPWLKEEAKAFPFEELFGASKPADAYVVLAQPGDADEFLSNVEGQMFAWFGDSAERAAALQPFFAEGNLDNMTADELLTMANAMHEKIEEERRKQKEELHGGTVRTRPKLIHRRADDESREDAQLFGFDTVPEDPQVIAIGGHGGASYVAWNLAAVTRIPLIEGRSTGSLAKWTGDQTPVHQALQETLPFGTVLDGELPKFIIGRRVIVDTGPDPHHPVFEHARIRIWVTTLDPAQLPVPERAKVIVNRVPAHLPFSSREVIRANIDLEVPDGGMDALLSLFTRIPWILKQDPEVQEQWRSLVKLPIDQQKGAVETCPTGW